MALPEDLSTTQTCPARSGLFPLAKPEFKGCCKSSLICLVNIEFISYGILKLTYTCPRLLALIYFSQTLKIDYLEIKFVFVIVIIKIVFLVS